MAKKKKSKQKDIGEVKPISIVDEMEDSYIDYAMSVIVSRALPDVRDGLKPVQRRILYTMEEMGLTSGSKFRKSAAVVGDVLGKYHPHGDAAVYAALVRMAQDFSLRYPLVKGQGNFGSIDDDPAAAPRYTECKLTALGHVMLNDIKKNTVDFEENYDGTKEEPTVLPSPVPQLLLNGSMGIAVGMATKIPPHNLTEVVDASIHLIGNPDASTEDLCEYIQGPDFPLGGKIFNKQQIISAYSKGKGGIKCRGTAKIEKGDRREKIIITEIPYEVKKSKLIQNNVKLIKKEKIKEIKTVRDETDKDGMRINLELKQGTYPQKVLNRLYKFTNLQKKFHLNLIALEEGIQPKRMGLVDVLENYLKHRKQVVIRRTEYELDKAQKRAHILEGLHKCLSDIDAVIETIKSSESRDDAKKNLKKKFELSDEQAEAILNTRLSSLAKLERQKIEEELEELKAKIKEYKTILDSEEKVKEVMKEELEEMKEKFGDERRTEVIDGEIKNINEKDLISKEETFITVSQGGYIKRVKPSVFKKQKRGGKGILGMKTVKNDVIEHFLSANTHDNLLFFTDSGTVFKIPAYEIPESRRVARGRGLVNFLGISPNEQVLSVMAYKEEDETNNLVMATKNGKIKRTEFKEFKNVRKSGLIAIKLKKGDALCQVGISKGNQEIQLVTQKGKSIRFDEKEVRKMGRPASGVKGIDLKKGDKVIGMDIFGSKSKKNRFLLVITKKGYGKKTELGEYRTQTRGGVGVKTANISKKTGKIADSKVLKDEEEILIIISKKGQVIKTPLEEVPRLGRATQGVKLMKLNRGDKVASLAYM